MLKFYLLFVRKIFFPIFWGGCITPVMHFQMARHEYHISDACGQIVDVAFDSSKDSLWLPVYVYWRVAILKNVITPCKLKIK